LRGRSFSSDIRHSEQQRVIPKEEQPDFHDREL
jgi:hypothetical protein